MAFYIVELPKCSHYGCEKKGTHEVRSSGTQSYGSYCKKHAEVMRKNLEEVFEKNKRTVQEFLKGSVGTGA